MGTNAPFVAEICALRYELLGYSDSMRNAAQYACRRYQSILSNMPGTDDIRQKIGLINDSLDRATLFHDEHRRSDIVLRSITELRMIIDMHLHALDADKSI